VKLTTHLHLVPGSKNEWNDTSTPQYAFMAWCLVKRSDNFFTFISLLCRQSKRRLVRFFGHFVRIDDVTQVRYKDIKWMRKTIQVFVGIPSCDTWRDHSQNCPNCVYTPATRIFPSILFPSV